MVDSWKKFLNIDVQLLESVNYSCVLRLSRLYQCAQHTRFFDIVVRSQDGVLPYLLSDKGIYLLLSWFMTLDKGEGEQIQFWNYCTKTNIKGKGRVNCWKCIWNHETIVLFKFKSQNYMQQLCMMFSMLVFYFIIWYLRLKNISQNWNYIWTYKQRLNFKPYQVTTTMEVLNPTIRGGWGFICFLCILCLVVWIFGFIT